MQAYLSVYLSMALHSFCWTLAAFSIFNPIHKGLEFLDGRSARRKVTACTQNKINTDKHPCLEWDLNPRPQCSCLRPSGHCYQQAFHYSCKHITDINKILTVYLTTRTTDHSTMSIYNIEWEEYQWIMNEKKFLKEVVMAWFEVLTLH
jgi:hypothetical protein